MDGGSHGSWPVSPGTGLVSSLRLRKKNPALLRATTFTKDYNETRFIHVNILSFYYSSFDYISDFRWPMQTRVAHDLHQKAGVPIGSCGIDLVKQFQAYLTDYQINIVSKEHQNSIIFSGPDKEKRIYLFLHDNHFDVITSMPTFVSRKKYCHTCKKGMIM